MADVRRYTDQEIADAYTRFRMAIKGQQVNVVEYVLASDYDALAAELAEQKQLRACERESIDTFIKQIRKLQVRNTALEAALGMHDAWPTIDILAKLIEAADHLLTVHGCDTHGHELFRAAVTAGKARIAALNSSASETDCECQEHKFERVAINNAKSPADPPEWAYGPYKCVRCGMYQSSDDA